ncbi:MAG: DUF3298 domain-containing protein [Clostridia bacterium]|nr:DUF3298 domain-containing protein [Clostridia bacterium]
MKRFLIPLLALFMLALLPAMAEQATVTLAEPLQGVYTWPEGSTEADALYVYRYSYPQLEGDSDVAQLINETYRYAVDDALGFEVPMLASGMTPGDPQKVVSIRHEITCHTAEHLSVCIIKEVAVGGESITVVSGHVFSLKGSNAGRITNLPVYMGLLDADETDEWLITRQTAKADKLVRSLVWAQMEAEGAAMGLYDDLTYEEVEAGFYPEEDFYLTAEGDVCFYFQAGVVAPEEQGLITFTFPMWYLLDEL